MSNEGLQATKSTPHSLAEQDAQAPAPGYKRTEVGVIPADWEVVRLADRCLTYSGGTPSTSRADFYGGDIPWITSGDLNAGRIREVSGRITQKGLDSSAARMVKRGDLVLALYGATAGVVAITEIDAAINQAVLAICTNRCDREYLFQHLTSRKANIVGTYTQGGQPNLSGSIIRSLAIALPPLAEQRAIAEVLSDVDGLLAALEALIAKKRAIKQAAMQQLLTGKTRLPGFSGEWEIKRLGEHVAFLRHGVNSRADLTSDGAVKYLHYGDIHTTADVYLEPGSDQMPRLPADRARTLDRLQDGDLVLVDASEDLDGVGKSVEIKKVGGEEVVAGLHTIAARFDKAVLADGFKAYLQFCPAFRNHLRRLAAGTKVYATSRAHVATVEMPLPEVHEQTAIASVLSDMDAEIAALAARRDKTRAIKQGTMQRLLSGRVRLVEPSPVEAGA